MRRIDVSGAELRFAAAHFATFGGGCEPLHGHNYALAVQLEGDLTDDSWLVDFREVRGLAAALCGELDHRFLLPLESRHLGVERREGHYEIVFGARRYVIPEADVRPLPIDNSTAERLAEWLAGRLAAELRSRGAANLSSLSVAVEEAPGQSASFTLPLATRAIVSDKSETPRQ
jgi:6-pyruvoyltetrahydropterin/6-carboxytetrahydropterin synthase